MRLELVLVGDELLVDRRGVQPTYIAELLEDMDADLAPQGVDIARVTVVGDAPGELAAVLSDAQRRGVDLLVTIGGLGPTHDDRVRDEVATVLGGGPPVPHPEAMERLESTYAARGIPLPGRGTGWERMAHVPPGATPLRNIEGMACGLDLVLPGGTRVVCLPGVTYEALPMWREHVAPLVEGLSGPSPAARSEATLVVRGLREGVVGPVVEDFLERNAGLEAGVYLTELVDGRFRGIRVTLRGPGPGVAEALPRLASELGGLEGATVELPGGEGDG